MSVYGNLVGCYSQVGKTFVIYDESGNELTGVVTDAEYMFDADPKNDIREGKTAVTDDGVVVGQKVIPHYHTSHGAKAVPAGSNFTIKLPHLDKYDYTVFHGIICLYNTTLANSTAAEKISVLDAVYPVQSAVSISKVTKDADTKSINLGLTNDSGKPCVLRYITYKEIA
jgi:hypothetical protein